MTWVVEVTGFGLGAAQTLVFAMGPGVAFTDHTFAPSGFVSWRSATQKVSVAREGGVVLSSDGGELILQNLPNDISQAGPLDALADYAWQNRRANLYSVTGALWSSRVLVDTALLQQPVVNLVAAGDLQSTLIFALRDPRAGLDVPLQNTKFLGTNVATAGVEGAADLKGKPKPILYGVVSNISPPRVNADQLIYQVADKGTSISILCVRDGGLGLTAGTIRGSLASLQSNTPPPAGYDVYSGAEGTFFKLGSRPVFQVMCDAQEGAAEANRTHAQVWNRFRQERCGNVVGDITAGSITACDALAAHEVGFWWSEDTTCLAAMNEILTSLSGFEVQGFDLKWSITKLVAPSGTTVLDFLPLAQTSALTSKSRALKSLTRVRADFAPDGAPPWRVNVQWGRNYTVMNEADFAGAAPQRLRDKFALEYRTETATDTGVWDPTTQTGPWINAPELTIRTAYQPGADGLSCPHAAAEAQALLDLYDASKNAYQIDFTPEVTDQIIAGNVVSLTYPQFLSAGPKFLVMWSQLVVAKEIANMTLLLGLQT